jgi:hypothetical protein
MYDQKLKTRIVKVKRYRTSNATRIREDMNKRSEVICGDATSRSLWCRQIFHPFNGFTTWGKRHETPPAFNPWIEKSGALRHTLCENGTKNKCLV